jgi:hypothetical protein
VIRERLNGIARRPPRLPPDSGSAGRMAGQYGTVALSEEPATYLARHRWRVKPLPPEMILVWNQAEGAVIAILHVTC